MTEPAAHDPSRPPSKNRRLGDFALEALKVTPEQVRAHVPTVLDVEIAQALLQGAISVAEIARHTGNKDATILDALTDQVRAAWTFDQVHRLAGYRVGLVVSSLLRRAVGGDVKACELYLKLFGKLADLHIVAHANADFSQFTDEDLRAQIRAEAIGVLDLDKQEETESE